MTNFWMRLTEAPTVFLLEPTARKFLSLPFLVILNYICFSMCKIQLTMNGKDVPKLLISDAPSFTYIFGKDIPANDSEIINFIVVQRMIMII